MICRANPSYPTFSAFAPVAPPALTACGGKRRFDVTGCRYLLYMSEASSTAFLQGEV
ncbi:conserved hypothetical protein [Culex quinquefasciatus]|uniref:Uncharacterized protein n=1 Tax=Culex quinquefasciatus TaxID=7176 RepID=B0W919_CULQU|nr:conserved hypothetical protein [Culex quinquefasciatus]|eukprot:XP_001845203.1 conserved hypothetical protein [Culex quinquefasciatus]